jgi:hypothetical protein
VSMGSLVAPCCRGGKPPAEGEGRSLRPREVGGWGREGEWVENRGTGSSNVELQSQVSYSSLTSLLPNCMILDQNN